MNLKTESKTLTLSNRDDADREYTIRGQATAHGGVFRSISAGEVFAREDETGMAVATFDTHSDGGLGVSYLRAMTTAQQVAVLKLIQEFVDAAKAEAGAPAE